MKIVDTPAPVSVELNTAVYISDVSEEEAL